MRVFPHPFVAQVGAILSLTSMSYCIVLLTHIFSLCASTAHYSRLRIGTVLRWLNQSQQQLAACVSAVCSGPSYAAPAFRCKQTMRSRIPDMNDKQLEKMAFLERCLHCLHVVGERIEVSGGKET